MNKEKRGRKKQMKNKKGISLIVLIITIIVMLIIAGAIIISLTETNVIDQAELAVEKHNISELKSAASMAYADYLANKHSDEQKIQLNVQDYIREQLIKQGVATWEDFSKWYITPTGGIEEIDQEALTIIVELDEADSYNIEILKMEGRRIDNMIKVAEEIIQQL